MSVEKHTYIKQNGKKNVTYCARVYVNGRRVATKRFPTKAAAFTWHDQVKDSWKSGLCIKTDKEHYRLSHLIEDFMEHPRGFLKMKKSSRQSFETRLPHFTRSPIYQVPMHHFDTLTVDSWLKWITGQATADCARRKSFTQELKVLHRLLSWYKNYVNVGFTIPIVERHREDAKYKGNLKRRRDYFIRHEDVRPWLDWLKSNYQDPFFYEIACFMVLTGARLGETCGLHWEAVDLTRGEAHIESVVAWDQKTRQPYLERDVKTTESNRVVQLPSPLMAILKEIAKRKGETKGLVFTDRNGRIPTDNAIRKRFNRGFKELGLPWTATRILRHTWGTLARVATQDLNKVQAVMGHTDIRMTQRYAKVAAMLDKSTVEDTAKLMGFE